MITKKQAEEAQYFHYGDCKKIVGPRGGVKIKIEEWRRNGKTQTWKRSPEKFRIPVKYGLYAYGQITEREAGQFHVASECGIEDK